MPKELHLLLITLVITTTFCSAISKETSTTKLPYSLGEVLHSDDFSDGLSNWLAEGGQPKLSDGKMELDTPVGSTVWFKPRLYGNVLIEYDVTVVDKAGPNDRVSDLNCFWMANDPAHPNDLFAASQQRNGVFKNYHALNLYYVGYGGNTNSTTRFRRYHSSERQLLSEYTDTAHLIVPNHEYHIQLVLFDHVAEYYRDGERLFRYEDLEPYRQGHFGLRTVQNHLIMDNFRIVRIHPAYGKRAGTEKNEYKDSETNAYVVRLTNSNRNDKHSYYDSPAFSPDGKYIVFSSAEPGQRHGDIYLANSDGTDIRRLAGSASFNMHTGALPWWHPDGKHVLYNAIIRGKSHIGIISIDGQEMRFQPGRRLRSLSPDGSKIIYNMSEEIFIIDLQTNEEHKIADINDMLALSPHQAEIARQRPHFQNPKWRPDGQELMIGVSNEGRGRRTTVKELYLLKPDGSNIRRLCDYRHHHSWTPDGKRILFNGTDDQGEQQLYLIDAAGGMPQRVLEGFDGGGHPIMSPNGRWIVTDVFRGKFKDSLVLIDMQSRKFRKLVNVPTVHGRSHQTGTHPHPSWSPDSKWVIYDSDQTGNCQVYLVRIQE